MLQETNLPIIILENRLHLHDVQEMVNMQIRQIMCKECELRKWNSDGMEATAHCTPVMAGTLRHRSELHRPGSQQHKQHDQN